MVKGETDSIPYDERSKTAELVTWLRKRFQIPL